MSSRCLKTALCEGLLDFGFVLEHAKDRARRRAALSWLQEIGDASLVGFK
jgi:hypothetical protein